MSDSKKNIDCEIAIIGGGLVGGAVAYGLAKLGHGVTIFDEGDDAFRASRGNFGLIWVQGKGGDEIGYAKWSRSSAKRWTGFAAELEERTGVDLQLQQNGGFIFCEDEAELEAEKRLLTKIKGEINEDYPFEILNNKELRDRIPEAGTNFAGSTWCPEDGHVNPLFLMRALHASYQQLGGKLCNGHKVESIKPVDGGFEIQHGANRYFAEKVVLAAGLGNKFLAPQLGLNAPVEPQRGQILITERVKPFLSHPTLHVRQTGEGTLQIGDSHENAGYDTGTSVRVISNVAKRAVKFFPFLEHIRLVRAWGALRIISTDGLPIYGESTSCPGAFVIACHSGVTLAANHADVIANWIAGGAKPDEIEVFDDKRF